MPQPKKRTALIQRRQNQRKKQSRLLKLSEYDRKLILQERRFHQLDPVPNIYTTQERTLRQVNKEHGKNFSEIVRKLAKKFPKRPVEILDEGTGHSKFLQELAQQHRMPSMRFTTTDIRDIGKPVHDAAPEELVAKFGKNRFHLIVSTWGGTHFSPVRKEKALVNIIASLVSGGMASVCVSNESDDNNPVRIAQKLARKLKNVSIRVEPQYRDPRYRVLSIHKR